MRKNKYSHRARPSQFIWLLVTRDKYEFPIYIEDTIKALAAKCGVAEGTIGHSVFSYDHGLTTKSRYHRVRIEDDDDENE